MDVWLRDSAHHADTSGTGRTFVWTRDTGEVVAYYTLAPHVVRRTDVPKRIGRGAPEALPAILLARLALSEQLHGCGLGAALVADALHRIAEAVKIAGGRLVVVDAIDAAAVAFYEHFGFEAVPNNPHRLVIKVSDVARSLGVSAE